MGVVRLVVWVACAVRQFVHRSPSCPQLATGGWGTPTLLTDWQGGTPPLGSGQGVGTVIPAVRVRVSWPVPLGGAGQGCGQALSRHLLRALRAADRAEVVRGGRRWIGWLTSGDATLPESCRIGRGLGIRRIAILRRRGPEFFRVLGVRRAAARRTVDPSPVDGVIRSARPVRYAVAGPVLRGGASPASGIAGRVRS